MNELVKKKMFTFEVRLSRMQSGSSLGDKVYTPVVIKGYLKEEMKIVTYGLGKEATSSAQVYIEGADMALVDSKDLVTVGINQLVNGVSSFIAIIENRQIIRRDNFYKPSSVPDVGVIYLA